MHDIKIKSIQTFFLLFLITAISHILIFANMGFFSHDEWQKFDDLNSNGLLAYLRLYSQIVTGSEFGVPIRPIGFIQQGLSSYFMNDFPVVSHGIDVLLHFFCATLLYLVLKSYLVPSLTALLSALMFIVSPLSVTATAWVAASFDNWLLIFILLVFLFIQKYFESEKNKYLILSCIFYSFAILSKETALVGVFCPLYVLMLNFLSNRRAANYKIVFFSQILFFLIFLVYIYIRLPAITNSIIGNSSPGYTPTIGNILRNIFLYFEYPFAANVGEMNNLNFVSFEIRSIYLAIHCIFVFLIYRVFGYKKVLLYLACYFVFLLPVISIKNIGAHYLTVSAVPLSVALAGLLIYTYKDSWPVFIASVFLSTILMAHFLYIGFIFYLDGKCQRTFLNNLTVVLSIEKESEIYIVPRGFAPDYVAKRSIFARPSYKRVKIDSRPAGGVTYYLEKNCEISK